MRTRLSERRKQFPLKKRIIILFAILSIVFFSLYFTYKEGSLPVNENQTTSVQFTIQKGENLNGIAKRLESEKLIRNKIVFFIIARNNGIEKKIQAGSFLLSASMNAEAIAQALTHGTNDVWIKLIEGMRKEEIGHEIAKTISINEERFRGLAKEGYLFPDTYLIPQSSDEEKIISIISKNFNEKVNTQMREGFKKNNLNLKDAIIIASLVEREARTDESRQKVASIILKRYLDGWQLGIDATTQYALGYSVEEKTWWRNNLTQEDLDNDSPYNTRKQTGLPPDPICNPSLSSILAVSNADSNIEYYFYLTGKDGNMYYAKTDEEHERNKKLHL